MTTDPLDAPGYKAERDAFERMVQAEYQNILTSNLMPDSLKGKGNTMMLKIATRKVARSIWLTPDARQPERDYGLR